MLYVHSFSEIEQQLSRDLALSNKITEVNCKELLTDDGRSDLYNYSNERILLYSFQSMNSYTHIKSFMEECEIVDFLIDFIVQYRFTKIIILTYPGAYYNSTNLFLQNKGLIEQKFVASGIAYILLSIQSISDSFRKKNSLHPLFYDEVKHEYEIPLKNTSIIYSIKLSNLTQIIKQAIDYPESSKFDVFDTVSDLKMFLQHYTDSAIVKQYSPFYLYIKSFLGNYVSVSMLELFLMPTIHMFKFRTEKELQVSLEPDYKAPIKNDRYKFVNLKPYSIKLNSLLMNR